MVAVRFLPEAFLRPSHSLITGICPGINGNAAKGIADLCHQAGAQLEGMGFIIEKSFQHGRDLLEKMGIRVESLAVVESLDNCQIKLKD